MRVWGVTGWRNAGKTTLAVRLVREFTARGLAVSTLKHTHHDVDLDRPGKDTFRHREAGARETILATARRFALLHEYREAGEAPLAELLARLAPVDLVLVEGWKRDRHPKVEVWRRAAGAPLIAAEDPTVRAVAADGPVPGLAVPVLPLDDAAAVADFILAELGLAGRRRP